MGIHGFWMAGALVAIAVTTFAAPARAFVACAKDRNANGVKIRGSEQCRRSETRVAVDADTLQGLTPQQLIAAKGVSPGGTGAPGLSVIDDVGQLVGYLMVIGNVERIVRPVSTGRLAAIPFQRVIGGGGTLAITRSRGIVNYYESADCSGQALLATTPRELILDAQVDVGGQVVYPGDFDTSQQLALRALRSWSRPQDDDGSPPCASDPGDPVSFPIPGGRCCFTLPVAEHKVVGPVLAEELPAFISPLHVAGF